MSTDQLDFIDFAREVGTAYRIAYDAHLGQVDKAGFSYFGHVARVARAVAPIDQCVIVALLHDVVEDTNVTLAELSNRGISEEVVSAVDAITRREGEAPEAYYARVRVNPWALRVKLLDIADNTDLTRLVLLDDATIVRLVHKYAKAKALLEPHWSIWKNSDQQGTPQ